MSPTIPTTKGYQSVVASHFATPVPNTTVCLISALRDLHPSSQHVPIKVNYSTSFPLSSYLRSVDVTTARIDDPATESVSYAVFEYDTSKKSVYSQVQCGITEFTWKGVGFRVYKASWDHERSSHVFFDMVFTGETDEIGQQLAAEVYKWANDLKEEIWVYEEGRWTKNKELYKAIKSAKWDDVVLDDKFKEGLTTDTKTFFENQGVYQSLGIVWKRGILLLGPPGNGKTESIKALLNQSGQNALYVKSMNSPWGPEYGVKTVFDHARKHSPCILILEDLDSMVSSKIRSFFLNELDGLARNEGILTIATTNHPERIDDAIINRPSRFDVKYHFGLPTHQLRRAFASKWIQKVRDLDPKNVDLFTQDREEIAEEVAQKTEGWSFAFLKELFISFLLRIAHDRARQSSKGLAVNGASTTEAVLFDQLDQLSAQILKINESEKDKKEEDEENPSWCPSREDDSTFAHAGDNF
ncbi:hypothetical protein JAAARDRAFT_40149 [Jaapia argillacea MUCL 33604]|uniref:AAA+ ATPase domain-containing protein n=1 Tax=Jaapia argillacea MUCL 33604 TaxID=933084 RepID=A0A067PQE6_9AGAM|nr:hypothetical protein JAAARDRAFT_40149 [Jaapia argillacea MUCL 33604]